MDIQYLNIVASKRVEYCISNSTLSYTAFPELVLVPGCEDTGCVCCRVEAVDVAAVAVVAC